MLRGAGILILAVVLTETAVPPVAVAGEPLVIAASPSVKAPVEALARAFEASHPDVNARIYFDTGLELRWTIAGMENKAGPETYFIGSGPIHVIAPGGDELLMRLETRYYVLPGTIHPYATVPLTLIVPVTLVDAPASFEELGKAKLRVAIADPKLTELGRQTSQLFKTLGIAGELKGRLDIATDARGVLDHLLYGQADVGVIFGPDAAKEQERIRVVATAGTPGFVPTVHSMGMERYCPNRKLCDEFLTFIQSVEAQKILKGLGYGAAGN